MLAILFISLITVYSFASTVNVTKSTIQTKFGSLIYCYFERSAGSSGTTPSTNTAQTPLGSSGSYSLTRGSTLYIWSPQFTSATTINSGKWVLNLYAATTSGSGPITVSIIITNSAGTVKTTIVNSVSTPSLTTTKSLVLMSWSIAAASVPVNGYIGVKLTAPSGSGNPSFTIYYGLNQQTDFQVPYRVLT